MLTEKWLSPKQIAEQYSVSKWTARRWIMRILGDEKKGREKRPRKLRRIAQSVLEEHLHELMNG
jgi:transposase